MKYKSWCLLSTGLIVLTIGVACQSAASNTIKIGGIFDLTGPTSDVGISYADGIRDYVDYVNMQGGINNTPVELIYEDYAYNIPQAEELYNRLGREQRVIAILGWGTGDTEALRARVASDKIPFMSASYSDELADITQSPYNFLIGVTYSDQMRIALRYIADTWTETSRKPRVALIYNDTAFGRSPIKDGVAYAEAHGIEMVRPVAGEDGVIVELSAQDATTQLQSIVDASGADYAIIQETANATSAILRSARQLNMTTQFITLNWGADEKVITLAGPAGEGLLGTSPFAFPYEDVTGLADMRAALKSLKKDDSDLNIRYIQGWTTARVLLAGIEKAGPNPSGTSVRSALETLADFDTGGITAPLTFSANSHKGASALKMYQVKNKRWEPITGYIEATP